MRCQKVQKLLPLYVGGDLRAGKDSKIESHLGCCFTCRAEFEAYRLSYTTTREWLAGDEIAWDEWDWKRVLHRAVDRNIGSEAALARLPFVLWPFRRVWAFVLMAGVAAGMSWILVRPLSQGPLGGLAEMTPVSIGEGPNSQERLSMTMVSQESGLKIVWFFDKNFELEDKQQ